MQPDQNAQAALIRALNEIIERTRTLSVGMAIADKLIARLERENDELRQERDDLTRARNEDLTRQAKSDAEKQKNTNAIHSIEFHDKS